MPFFSSSFYHVSTSILSRTPVACRPPPQYPPAVRSVLQEVLQRLGEPATPEARRLQGDVKRWLDAADRTEHMLEATPLPSLAQALELRDRARFDLVLRPDALTRLISGQREFLRRWKEDSMPTDSPLHRRLLQWEADLHAAMDKAEGKPTFSRLRELDDQLEALDQERQHLLAARDAHIAAKVRAQANGQANGQARRDTPGCTTFSAARPPGARSPGARSPAPD